MSSRRGFLREITAATLATPKTGLAAEAVQRHGAGTPTGEGRVIVPLVNHVGYRPGATKFVIIEDLPGAESFEIVRLHKKGSKPRFVGKLVRAGTDFGPYLIGDFSSSAISRRSRSRASTV